MLVGLGVDELSASVPLVPAVKAQVRATLAGGVPGDRARGAGRRPTARKCARWWRGAHHREHRR